MRSPAATTAPLLVLLCALVCTLHISPAAGSIGDRSKAYRSCVSERMESTCASYSASGALALLHWTCEDEARYQCMWEVTEAWLAKGDGPFQFHGKWPFARFLGMQEPASVAFSIGNFVAHVHGLRSYLATVPDSYNMRSYWIVYAFSNLNVWTWSTVFHSRDRLWTERLDYFSATANLTVGVFVAVVRVFRLTSFKAKFALGFVLTFFMTLHIGYLSLIRFDYGYNAAATAAVGGLHSLLWLYFHISTRRPYAYLSTICVFLLTGFMMLELLDFPPFLWTFDAHSLWHLSTIPVVYIWWRFLIADALYETESSESKAV